VKRNAGRALRRAGASDITLEVEVKQSRREFHHTVRKQKKHHWIDFLAEPTNIWKAAKFLEPKGATSFARILALNNESGQTTSNEGIAEELLESFFPPLITTPEVMSHHVTEQLPLEPLTIEDVRRAIFDANPNKAPGMDGLPMLVWKMLWPCLQDELLSLFSKSLNQGKLPSEWKIAKIIPLHYQDQYFQLMEFPIESCRLDEMVGYWCDGPYKHDVVKRYAIRSQDLVHWQLRVTKKRG